MTYTETLPLADDFLAFCKSTCAPATVRNHTLALFLLQAYRCDHPGEIKPLYLTKFFEAMVTKGLRRGTISEYYSKLKCYFDYCVERGIWQTSPLRKPTLPNTEPRPKPIFTAADYEKLKAVAQEREDEWHDVIVTCWNTGFRISDVAKLEWSAIDLSARLITLKPQKQARFGKTLAMPILDELRNVLVGRLADAWTDPDCDPPTYVFPQMSLLTRFSGETGEIAQQFRRIAIKAVVPFTAIHGLRRSFVSRLANSGELPQVICSLTGHSMKEVMTYVQIDLSTKQQAMAKLNAI